MYATPPPTTAGELKTRSPVAKRQTGLPSRPTTYSSPSWLPTTADPSGVMAGGEVPGPRVPRLQGTGGGVAGAGWGGRPRCSGPKGNTARGGPASAGVGRGAGGGVPGGG